MKFYAQISPKNIIIPATDFDYDIFKKVKKNSIVAFDVKQERNIGFHRKFFVLMNLLFENQSNYNNLDDYRYDLIIASGYYEEKTNYFTGEISMKAKSISFSNMDEIEFQDVYKAVIDTALRIIPMEKQKLLDTIEQYF